MPTKSELRTAARAARRHQADRETLSRRITDRVTAMEAYRRAECVLWYVGARDEVQTRHVLSRSPPPAQRIAVPYCEGTELRLLRIDDDDDLETGAFGIAEPRRELRRIADRQVAPAAVDVAIIPGVAFDLSGGRLGYGRGFYDRLLCQLRDSALRVALAFECQLFQQIPVDPHDVPMQRIATQARLIHCRPPPVAGSDAGGAPPTRTP